MYNRQMTNLIKRYHKKNNNMNEESIYIFYPEKFILSFFTKATLAIKNKMANADLYFSIFY